MKRAILAGMAVVGLSLMSSGALAQSTLDNPLGEMVPYALDTGLMDNFTSSSDVVFVDEIRVPEAAWIRVYFDVVDLGPGSKVRITSALDGEVQTLDAAGIAMWNESTAYFNGDSLMIELIAGPGSRDNRLAITEVAAEFPIEHTMGDCGICGPDNRFPSGEEWAGRLMPVGCTASVYNEASCLVSAGHCMGSNNVMQFRVPPSNSNCTTNNPPVAEQFPITDYEYLNGGVGADWAAMTCGTNSLGELPYERYGQLRPIAPSPSNVGDAVNVWGYAIDDECVRSQVQQDSNGGTISFRSGTHYEFNVDITFGNSGSALIENGEIIGIVTHCSYGCPNYATRVDVGAFAQARNVACYGSEDLFLSQMTPGIAGQNNSITCTGAAPNQVVSFYYGIGTGSSPVPGCPGLFFDLAVPKFAGNVTADGSGSATLTGFVPGSLRGRSLLMQAYESFTCRITNMVVQRFPR